MKKILMCLLLASVSVFGITHPTVSKFDKRITYTKYNAEDVFIIKAKVGYVSMVRFNEDEKVVVLSSGFSNGLEIIDVDNMLFVKPVVYNVKTAEQETITGSDGKPVKLSCIAMPDRWEISLSSYLVGESWVKISIEPKISLSFFIWKIFTFKGIL